MLPTKAPLPQAAIAWFTQQQRQDYAQYIAKLDAVIIALSAGNLFPLVNAANDAAAARAGVAIGQVYQNNGAMRVRLT